LTTARVFEVDGEQAVELPKEFRVASNEVEIFRRGDEIILREKPRDMSRVLDLLAELAGDGLENRRDEPPQEREGL
jgi:antitoxin VapB